MRIGNYGRAALGALAFVSATLFGENGQTIQTTIFRPKLVGMADIRPTLTTSSGNWGTEDTYELGVRVSPNTTYSYAQGMQMNLHDPAIGSARGLDPRFDLGFARARFNNLWDDNNGLSFSFEPRLYAPTSASLRDRGMISMVRNYFKFNKVFDDRFSVMAIEMPILHLYDRPGFIGATGPGANPIFENRVYLIGNINFTKSLSLSVPLMFHQKRSREFQAGAVNNSAWDYFVWTYPEITYSVAPNASVGVAYYSGNLVKPDLSETTITQGLESGAVQVALTATL